MKVVSSAAVELEEQVQRAAALDEPIRLALYRYIRGRAPAAVGRDEAAKATGIGRKLAAFHLDRLALVGLLEVSYKRLSGRQGPGAGRPAKLYQPAKTELSISLPPRRYDLAARILASALGLRPGVSSTRGLQRAARDFGRAVGVGARSDGLHLQDVLREQGFEHVDAGGEIRLRNCPFHSLSQEFRRPICEMNLAFQEGILAGLGRDDLRTRLTPEEGYCCVTFEQRSTTIRGQSAATGLRSFLTGRRIGSR
jgi:predicted ArsR family transcriptional regulator